MLSHHQHSWETLTVHCYVCTMNRQNGHQNWINGLWVMLLRLDFVTGVGKQQLTGHSCL